MRKGNEKRFVLSFLNVLVQKKKKKKMKCGPSVILYPKKEYPKNVPLDLKRISNSLVVNTVVYSILKR